MMFWIFFFLCAVVIYIKLVKPLKYWDEKKVQNEKPWPIVGNMVPMLFRLTSFAELIEDLYKKANSRYFGIHQFIKPALVIKDINLIKQICIKDFDSFLDHTSFVSEELDPIFGNNLFALKGEKWRHMRSTLSPAFTSSKMRTMFVFISDCADQFTTYLLKHADPTKATTVDMKDLITRFANDVIATCAFGIKCNSLEERSNEFYLMGKRASNFEGVRSLRFFGYAVSPFLMNLMSVRLIDKDVSDFFRYLVTSTMNTREQQGIVRPDMIHLLMQARKGNLKFEDSAKVKDEDAGFATVEESHVGKETEKKITELSDDDITAQAVLFFNAGFDTTSILICHMSNELAVNPDIQVRLQTEIDEMLQTCDGKITYDAIMKMKYLDMVLSETLRKWPPASFSDRICTKDYIIDASEPGEESLELCKGDSLWIPIYAIQRDPQYYPNPDKFDPERFSDENKDKIKPMTYIPFGAGPRNCIGSRFALLEAKTIFIHLLSKFDIVVDKKTQVPLKLSCANINMSPQKGFWMGMKPRCKNSKI